MKKKGFQIEVPPEEEEQKGTGLDFMKETEEFTREGLVNSIELIRKIPETKSVVLRVKTLEGFTLFVECSQVKYEVSREDYWY